MPAKARRGRCRGTPGVSLQVPVGMHHRPLARPLAKFRGVLSQQGTDLDRAASGPKRKPASASQRRCRASSCARTVSGEFGLLTCLDRREMAAPLHLDHLQCVRPAGRRRTSPLPRSSTYGTRLWAAWNGSDSFRRCCRNSRRRTWTAMLLFQNRKLPSRSVCRASEGAVRCIPPSGLARLCGA